MTMQSKMLAEGTGWQVREMTCTAGPGDRAFEERHGTVCIAAVVAGSFRYRSSTGTALMAPGALLLGNHGECFECGHEHGIGDRCVSFHFEPGCWQDIVAGVPGMRTSRLAAPKLPPLPRWLPLLSGIHAVRGASDPAAVESLALHLAGTVAAALADAEPVPRRISRRELQCVSDAVRRIEQTTDDPLSLTDLAAGAAMSRYHFLRVFERVVGVTPHQFLLRTRMQRAADRLRRSDAAVARIALDAGFADLSTFHRQFRRWFGTTPHAYRQGRPAH